MVVAQTRSKSGSLLLGDSPFIWGWKSASIRSIYERYRLCCKVASVLSSLSQCNLQVRSWSIRLGFLWQNKARWNSTSARSCRRGVLKQSEKTCQLEQGQKTSWRSVSSLCHLLISYKNPEYQCFYNVSIYRFNCSERSLLAGIFAAIMGARCK